MQLMQSLFAKLRPEKDGKNFGQYILGWQRGFIHNETLKDENKQTEERKMALDFEGILMRLMAYPRALWGKLAI